MSYNTIHSLNLLVVDYYSMTLNFAPHTKSVKHPKPHNSGNMLQQGYHYILQCCIIICLSAYAGNAQTLPNGFSQVLVASGITRPTAMAFAPDGRIFVCQQNGQLRVVKNNVLLSQPMVSLTVTSSGERGLIGVAIDPNFAVNHYIYLVER
ncbi:MAG TPA: PQQ-dependent sugar dehydrogenase [Flavitalea sp.]|nr:PQQ-dependent sugar dehydrogenase [Flavitalea sp.]